LACQTYVDRLVLESKSLSVRVAGQERQRKLVQS